MNNNKLDRKRKLSLDDDDEISFKKKTTIETNLLSSSNKDYRENVGDVFCEINKKTNFIRILYETQLSCLFAFLLTSSFTEIFYCFL